MSKEAWEKSFFGFTFLEVFFCLGFGIDFSVESLSSSLLFFWFSILLEDSLFLDEFLTEPEETRTLENWFFPEGSLFLFSAIVGALGFSFREVDVSTLGIRELASFIFCVGVLPRGIFFVLVEVILKGLLLFLGFG